MAHAIWSGTINFGLVNIPVRLVTAVRDASGVHFNFLHDEDGGTLHNERICNECGKKVSWDHVTRGYPYKKGEYVVVDDEDFQAASVEATQSIDIVQFANEDEIDPMLYEKPYYLEPEKKAHHAYALLRSALAESGKVGIARVVLRSREHIAALKPSGDALVLGMLHWKTDIVGADTLDLPKAGARSEKTRPGEMKAANMLIESMTAKFDIGEFHDTYHEKLMALIQRKARGKPMPKLKKTRPRATNVVDLADVLQRSLAATKRKRTRKAAA
ncbi:Ku protein [Pendulispora rubella]|uniref:non-homologous end joining protein Ku n=1 Tax=Pendulispora rubella TaxID=2741070 RepID=UPI00374E0168